MSETYHLSGREPIIQRILRYSSYTGRRITLRIASRAYVGGEWSGGSRTITSFFDMRTMGDYKIPVRRAAYGERDFGASTGVDIPEHVVAIEHTEGSSPRLSLVTSEETAELYKLIPANDSDKLSWTEKVVLIACKHWKATSGGEKNIRRTNAMRELNGYRHDLHDDPPRVLAAAEYDEAKERLIRRGYLTKVGGLNIAGRNAIGAIDWHNLGAKPDEFIQALEHTFREDLVDPVAEEAKAAIITYNERRKTIEVRFPVKPVRAVLDLLKKNHFRWGMDKEWYRSVVDDPQVVLAQTKAFLGIQETV